MDPAEPAALRQPATMRSHPHATVVTPDRSATLRDRIGEGEVACAASAADAPLQ
jgi:hypothetical protein